MKDEKVCDVCQSEIQVGNEVESVFHEHHNASGVCKKIKFVGHFESVANNERPDLCLSCQGKLVSGFCSGGNWKVIS